MKVIKKGEFYTRYRITCKECLSLLEGKDDDFKQSSDSTTEMYFYCPVCKKNQYVSTYYRPNWRTMVRYRINDDGSMGEEIKD